MFYISKGLLLRKPSAQDAEALYELKNERESARLLGGFSCGYSREDIADWIVFHRKRSDEQVFLIEDRKCVVGHVGLYNIDFRVRKGEFAILIGKPEARGRGIGEACTKWMCDFAFENLNLQRIELTVLSENLRALNLYKKCGFETEGVQRRAQYKDGKYLDIIFMSRLNGSF